MPRRHGSTDDDDASNHRKRRRNRMRVSCLNCYASKRKCDRKRPCTRCIQHGLTGLCVYELDDPSSRDPDQDEVTHLRCRIAELESIIRELNNRPHPRWLADTHDVRRFLGQPPSKTPPVDSASESRASSRPPKRKTATKAAAKNSLDAFFDSVLESDDDHLTAPCKRRRVKLEQRDSDDDEYMPDSCVASPPPFLTLPLSPLTPLSSSNSAHRSQTQSPQIPDWTPHAVSTPSSSISEALLAELPLKTKDDCPPRPSSPFPFLRDHPRRQVEPARILFPPTPGHFYPVSESGSDTSDDIPLAHGMAQALCSQQDQVQADAESVIDSVVESPSRAIQTSPPPSPETHHCPCLTTRSLYTPLLYFASALRDARVVLEAVHGGTRGDEEEERRRGDCELWTRVKALEEYVFSQDRMASLADAQNSVHDTVCFPESSMSPSSAFPGCLPHTAHDQPADDLTYPSHASHHEDTRVSFSHRILRPAPSEGSSSSVHSLSPNSGPDLPFTYIYHAQNALNLDLYGDGPTSHDASFFNFDSSYSSEASLATSSDSSLCYPVAPMRIPAFAPSSPATEPATTPRMPFNGYYDDSPGSSSVSSESPYHTGLGAAGDRAGPSEEHRASELGRDAPSPSFGGTLPAFRVVGYPFEAEAGQSSGSASGRALAAAAAAV